MSVDAARALIARIAGSKWPQDETLMRYLNTWAALREADTDALQRVRSWDARRAYRIDPLPELISDTWASYLFGEEPQVRPSNDSDADALEELLTVNHFASELERAAGLCSSEGEIWARIYVDELVAPRPLLTWVSRRNIVPMWVGPRLAAAAIVTELPPPPGAARGSVYRALEVHAPGIVVNTLLIGREDKAGDEADLGQHPDTEELSPEWQTGVPGMLVRRIPNRLRADPRVGVSDYAGVLDYLLDLNEAVAIGSHNMRLTARKRAVISAAIAQHYAGLSGAIPSANAYVENTDPAGGPGVPRARFDPAEEVFVADPLDAELGKANDPLRILEYSFDADALIAWKSELVISAITRVGLTAQYVGAQDAGGYAISGTALRLRLIPTDARGRSKGRYWDDEVPAILATMATLDGTRSANTPLGRPWTDPRTEPTVKRRPGIPVDPVEETTIHTQRVNAGLESRRTALKALNPEWDDATVDDELRQIDEDRPPAGGMGAANPFNLGA